MFKHLREASLVAAVVAALPALASAETIGYGTAPVAVKACATSDNTTLVAPVSLGGFMLHSSNDIDLSYVNTGNLTATSVTFVVNDGNRINRVTARGSFAPGVAIDRTFSAAADGSNGLAACAVAEVHFSDGSVWPAQPQIVGSR